MLNKVKEAFGPMEVICSSCGKEVKAGEKFSAVMIMPSEKDTVVSRIEVGIARKAEQILCENCME